MDRQVQTCHSSFLTIVPDTAEETRRVCDILKEGSETIYPLEATTYSVCRVSFADKFGIRRGLMTE